MANEPALDLQRDLFGAHPPSPGQRRATAAPRLELDVEAAARMLDDHNDYRVLRRVRPRAPIGRRPLRTGEQLLVLLDTETTGLDCGRHEIIELGMLAVIHDAEGVIIGVAEQFSGLREPSEPLPAEITAITGITPQMLLGQAIDINAVERFIADAHRVCCHNSRFDRGFADRFSPGFEYLPWACSLREVDWKAIGTVGMKLEHILGHFGLFHGAHRAVHDCHALLEILAQPHPAGGTILRHLIASCDRTTARIWAINSPFERKDDLKRRGYHWGDGSDGQPKAWWIEVDEMTLADELEFLRREIYGWDAEPIVQRLTAAERYKAQ